MEGMTDRFTQLPLPALTDHRLGLIDLRVLGAVYSFGSKPGDEVWPSRASIGTRAGYNNTNISKAISRLVAFGWLARKQHRGPNTYVLTVPELETVSEVETVSESDTKQCPVRTHLRTDQEETIDKEIPPKPPKREVDKLFTRFWAAYPKKRSKGQAERAFAQLKPNEQLLAEILLGLQRAMTSDSRFTGDTQYTPYASTWLNAKGWQDEHDQDIPKPATSAAYGQQPRTANSNRNGADHATHQRPDNSAPAKVARAIAERDAARQQAGPGIPPDDFIELGSGDYWAVAY